MLGAAAVAFALGIVIADVLRSLGSSIGGALIDVAGDSDYGLGGLSFTSSFEVAGVRVVYGAFAEALVSLMLGIALAVILWRRYAPNFVKGVSG